MKTQFRQSVFAVISASLLLSFASTGSANDLTIASRIVGGDETEISSVPATVALVNNAILGATGSLFQAQFCGGTVIDERWVLSAAHCFFDGSGAVIPASSLSVVMGSTDLENPINQPVGITQIIVHEDYDPRGQANDIALLELQSNALAPPIALDQQATALNDLAFIAGWGALQSGDNGQQQTFPAILRGAFVRMVPGVQCGQLFPAYQGQVDDSQICAGVVQGGVDSCQGDSGGPLFRVSESNSQLISLAGITSFGIGCGGATTPGVYTNVAAFGDWIQTTTGGVSTNAPVAPTQANPPVAVPVNDDPAQPQVNQPDAPQVPQQVPQQNPQEVPQQNPQQVPSNPFAPEGTSNPGSTQVTSTAGAAAGAGASGFMLPLLALLVLMRKRSVRHLTDNRISPLNEVPGKQSPELKRQATRLLTVIAGIVTLTLGAQTLHADDNQGMSISLTTLPFTETRDDIVQMAQPLWGAEPVCTLVRTGYGMTRRAYFLETCTFAHEGQNTVLGEAPGKIEYQFLEGKLVQVAFSFDEIRDEKQFRRCARQQTEELQKTPQHTIRIDHDFRVMVSDTETVERIHVLKGSLHSI